MTAAPANLSSVVRRRNMALVRTTDYQDQGEMPAATLDSDFDSAVLMIQQVDEQIGRAVTVPAGVTGFNGQLPDPVSSMFLRINTAADGFDLVSEVTPGALTVTPFIETLLNDTDATAARTTLGAQVAGSYQAAGSYAASGANNDITSLTALTTPLTSAQGGAQIQPISATVAANALTISASALSLDFRGALNSGAVTRVSGTPANLVISSGSTLGTVNAQQSRIVVLAINNAGTIELAAVNIAGGNDLSETGLITTTAEGGSGGADTSNVVYSTTARTGVAYRVIGYIESTQATAGTWATAPSTIQGAGGQALASMSSLGYGQTWQNVTGSRALGTTYYNTTGKPIVAQILFVPTVAGNGGVMTIGGVSLSQTTQVPLSAGTAGTFVIPAGASYVASGSVALSNWVELR
jgi:hypothetical protein